MKQFKLFGGPAILVQIGAGNCTVEIDGTTITLPLTCVGVPQTLRGCFPGVLGWVEICRCSRFGRNHPETDGRFLYINVVQIARWFSEMRGNDNMQQHAILEVPLSGNGLLLEDVVQ